MSRIKINFQLPYPTFIESLIVYFLLRYRKKHYGFAFRRIKLITDKDVDSKHRYTIVDHRNGEGLDNTKRNLRFATASQNSCNCKPRKKDSSKYRGVRFEKRRGKWRCVINYNGTRRHLGYFDNEEDAARAYDEAAKIYHGEFAVLNFPQVAATSDGNSLKSVLNCNVLLKVFYELFRQILPKSGSLSPESD